MHVHVDLAVVVGGGGKFEQKPLYFVCLLAPFAPFPLLCECQPLTVLSTLHSVVCSVSCSLLFTLTRLTELSRLGRGKRSIALNLKTDGGRDALLQLAAKADVLIEPFRPGKMESLGLGPDRLLEKNPALIYARLTGFGQTGSLAPRAGHDLNYIAIAGALSLFGRAGEKPMWPGNLLADFAGGGMLCALGICMALLERTRSGRGQVIDAAMVDGTSYLSSFVYRARDLGLWSGPRGTNLLDGGAPFYDTYETKDGLYMAIGSIEPQFYAELCNVLGLQEDPIFQGQFVLDNWPAMREKLTEIFLSRTRAEWIERFSGHDACVTAVLSLDEVDQHPHNRERVLVADSQHGHKMPEPAPRLSRTPALADHSTPIAEPGQHTDEILREFGFSWAHIKTLAQDGSTPPSASL